jgi:hypothetical protein
MKKIAGIIFAVCVLSFSVLCGCGGGDKIEASLYITCEKVFERGEEFGAERMPERAEILTRKTFETDDKTSVFTFLLTVLKEQGIHSDAFAGYVRAIANVYEFDYGGESGWLVRVNGEFIKTGAGSRYVKDGDEIEWLYSVKKGDYTDTL